MKKILLFLCVAVGLNLFAQEEINEGVLISRNTMSSDNEMINEQMKQMGDTESKTYFKGDKSRNEANNPVTGELTIIIDGTAKQMLMLINQSTMGKKYKLESIDPTALEASETTVIKGDKTKTVMGYVCREYIVNTKQNGQDVEMQMFTTDKITAMSQNTTVAGGKVKGFPLYFVVKMSQMGANIEIVSEVTEIKKEVVSDAKLTLTPPEGYTEMKGM